MRVKLSLSLSLSSLARNEVRLRTYNRGEYLMQMKRHGENDKYSKVIGKTKWCACHLILLS